MQANFKADKYSGLITIRQWARNGVPRGAKRVSMRFARLLLSRQKCFRSHAIVDFRSRPGASSITFVVVRARNRRTCKLVYEGRAGAAIAYIGGGRRS